MKENNFQTQEQSLHLGNVVLLPSRKLPNLETRRNPVTSTFTVIISKQSIAQQGDAAKMLLPGENILSLQSEVLLCLCSSLGGQA